MASPHAVMSDATAVVDARPILQQVTTGVFVRAEQMRDKLYSTCEAMLRELSIDALVVKSPPQVHPCWVKVEGWVPVGEEMVTERCSAIITIQPMAFHRFDLEATVALDNRCRTKVIDRLSAIDEPALRRILDYLFRNGPKPALSEARMRQNYWQFWRDKNKVDVLEKDWLGQVPGILIVLGLFTFMFGGVILIAAGIACWLVIRKRPTSVRSTGRPAAQPRNLIRVDSWQTVISGAGADLETIGSRFEQSLQSPPSATFRSWRERIWHWGLEGKEERDQRVLTMGRAMLFCHTYAYGTELYVGWDSHLNAGCWVENTVASGKDKQSGNLTKFNSVVVGTQRLNEYDVTDVNCLTEWAHAQLVKTLKRYMDEKKIDQEIDFKILRGERQGLMEESNERAKKAGRSFIKKAAAVTE